MAYLYLTLAILSEVTATSFMKQTEGFTQPIPSIVTIVGYAAAFYFLSLTLHDIPTGVAYAVWAGVGIVLITAIAWVFQGQALDPPAVIGIALILSGVIVLNVFSKSIRH